MAEKKRKRPLPKLEKNTIPAPGNVPTTRLVTIEGNKTVSIKEKIVATAAPQNLVAPTVTESPPPGNESPEPEEETITQTGKLMAEYGDKLPDIIRLWVARKSSARVGSPCYCGNGVRTTQCRDCRQYDLSCESCWIRNHENNPFHWAHVWKAELGFFVKHDISAVDGGNHAVSLGHYGKPCPNAGTSQMTTLVEPNGIHATKIYFCGCHDNPSVDSKFDQLMEAGYFPSSTDSPRTAFSFDVLKRFHLASLESKTAALDYISCLRRLTDNSTTAEVPDPYPAFLPTNRIYQYLKTLVRLGQVHGIDLFMPYRMAENLVVTCPTCPEIGVNVDIDLPRTPLWLRHIMQNQLTLDGNFHTGHFVKNCDPNDISLCNGKGQFPPDEEYRTYLKSIPVTKEKSTCVYLKVVNRQDRKKFKNMDVTGTINAQCSHVFVVASVDMHHSERFANADAALARMLRRMDLRRSGDVKLRLALENIDQVVTYDIACEYYVKIKARFRASPDLADVADIVDRIRWGIPALHVTGHKADCMYLFGTAYMDCVGHFHGETAEAYWPSANKIGGHARQMNNGHRQDTLIANANDWNWKKTVKMHVSLYDDLSSAKKLFLQKRKLFIGLSLSNLDEIEGWQAMARQTQKYNGGVKSVYRHTTSKVPSQTAIYQHMITNLENFASTQIPTNEIGAFLKAGLKIQADQRKIMDARSKNDEHDLQATKKEISTRRTKLTALLGKWRDVRDNIMVEPADSIACAQSCEIELEKLWLPSDFTEAERVAMGPNIIALAAEEAKLREGEAYDLIRVIQTICRGLSALEDRKKDVRGQKDNTISGEQVLDTRHRRDCAIKAYNSVRKALLHLGMIQDGGDKKDSQFPHLTVDDTFMKSRRRERALGDSRRGDGMLYTRIGVSAGSKVSNAPEVVEEGDEDDSGGEPDSKRRCQGNEGGPQMNKRSKRKPAAEKRKEKELEALTALDPNPANKNGWLWELRRPSNMTDIEMQQWEREGDRVQWARAEAEMDRFQEQLEIKIAEFLRCIASFDFNAQVWTKMSANEQPGFQEQAKETAYMWMTLGDQCRKHLKMAGYQFALEPGFDFPALIAYLEKERDRNDALIREAGIGQFTI
ncbi:hypothetical protein DFH09DRAFT_1330882 [Mycena vulgaris]|nr:hypothetical protein DFH09DRAFT_1330882 [Mycena vulgaris]